jgi:hypothetical protein
MSSVSNDRVDEVILQTISRYTHLSISALYTQLLLKKKISYVVYKAKMEAVAQYLAEQRLKAEAAKQLTKELGLDTGRGRRPQTNPLALTCFPYSVTPFTKVSERDGFLQKPEH